MRGSHGKRRALLALACLSAAACSGSGSSGATGAVEQTSTKASQAGASGAVVDFDGDGVADLLVGAPYAVRTSGVGLVRVHRGTAAGFEPGVLATLTGGDNFGAAVAAIGDVDGDGREDFAVAAPNGDGAAAALSGEVTVFRGGGRGTVLARLSGEQALDRFGAHLTGGCDLDHDGRPDLVVGATHHSPAPDRWLGGAVYVHFGPTLSEAARVKLGATATKGILGFSSACGDVNGDGVDDLAVSAIWTHGVIWHASKVLVWFGGPGFAPTTDAPDVTVDSTASHFGDGLAILDVDGDAKAELAIGVPALYAIPTPSPANPMASLKGRVFVLRGAALTAGSTINLSPTPPTAPIPALLTTLYGGEYLERFGAVVAALGDVDGDGKADLAVSAPHASAPGATGLDDGRATGVVRVFSGKDLRTDGTATQASAGRTLARPLRSLHYGQFLAAFQRGGAKLAVGAPTANRQDGAVFVEDLAPAAP
jgi:hypothetical protein